MVLNRLRNLVGSGYTLGEPPVNGSSLVNTHCLIGSGPPVPAVMR